MESQDTEYKRSWNDDYYRWICAFANTKGGTLFIGIEDNGEICGIENYKKLMEDIPNKTRDILGIFIDVNLKNKEKKYYLEIKVEAYPYPVSYKGEYHIRVGSTKQELKGAALDRFILKKQGRRWDSVPQPNLALSDFSTEAFDYFKKKSLDFNRIYEDDAKDSPEVLLEKLILTTDTQYYKRASVLLFHSKPEKYITGSYIKIGFFRNDHDLAFQDEIHGYLFQQVEKTLDLLLTKYLIASISYDVLHRKETFPIPVAALREALLNAVIHKDYGSFNPIQISVYSNKIMIWNEGHLPENWTVARLKVKHPSVPFNPDIANCFFRAGLIEAWGRGTIKILNECKAAKVKPPIFKFDGGFLVEFKFSSEKLEIDGSTSDKVLSLLKQDNKLTIAEMSTKISVTIITIKRILKGLQNTNRVKREGNNRAGKWILVDE
jgi:ATP-dependent DNA helicase RecG